MGSRTQAWAWASAGILAMAAVAVSLCRGHQAGGPPQDGSQAVGRSAGGADNPPALLTVHRFPAVPGVVMSSPPAASSPAPRLRYWHVWTDADGISRQSQSEVDDFHLNSISAGAAAQWIGPRTQGEMTVLFTVLPPGWQGDWHENPAPQWIVPLSGGWGVETMDGQRVEMGVGEVSFGADQGTRERDGRRGHRSWIVGDQAAVLMLVQLGPGVPQPPVPGAR